MPQKVLPICAIQNGERGDSRPCWAQPLMVCTSWQKAGVSASSPWVMFLGSAASAAVVLSAMAAAAAQPAMRASGMSVLVVWWCPGNSVGA